MIEDMDEDLTEFGAEVQRHLDRLGWSRRRLAEEAGLTPGTVSRVMRGLNRPEDETIEAIANALRIDALKLKRLAGYLVPDPSHRNESVEYIAERLEALPPELRDRAIHALRTQLDAIYDLTGQPETTQKRPEDRPWSEVSFEEAEEMGKDAMLQWARANRKRFMEIVSELGLDVPDSSTGDRTSSETPPQRRTGT